MPGFVNRLKRCRAIGLAIVGIIAAVLALDRLFPPPIDKVRTSTVVTDHLGAWLHGFTVTEANGEKRWRLAAEIDAIDPVFVARVVEIEDKRFWSHPGVDMLAVLRATGSMLRQGEVVSGASTITMQTARLLEPRPRTVPSKIIEMIRAVQIEARLSKEEILELYLTLAPYGGNLEGVGSASRAWFGKDPARLTDAQQALLIALPQAPEARRPDRQPQAAASARDTILAKLYSSGHLTTQQLAEAQEASLPANRRPFKRLAWHTSFENRKQVNRHGRVQLSLDAMMQETLEAMVSKRAAQMPDKANVAILVVENRQRAVRAAIGSADLDLPGGWIDMTRAQRSPGSTLKPFIYGLAFEDGFAGGNTLIDDAPYSFDGYRPENFTRVFHGDVTVSEALQHSLNVPAVLALDKIGPKRFAAALAAAGVDARMPVTADAKASLAIALGGVGLTARDLAMLYTGLANGGEVGPLIWSGAEIPEPGPSYRLMTEANAARLTRIMRKAPAPAGRTPAMLSIGAPQVAFKTGTSYGYRDAWAAGYTDDYTVIVWAGHPNGTPRPGKTGREAVLPLLFDIFDRLQDFDRPHDANIEVDESDNFETGTALARLAPMKRELAPEIVFPENGVTIFYSEAERARGFALSARGGAGTYRWYVDGRPVNPESLGGRSIWHPDNAGFYNVKVVDDTGQTSTSSVRVLSAG